MRQAAVSDCFQSVVVVDDAVVEVGIFVVVVDVIGYDDIDYDLGFVVVVAVVVVYVAQVVFVVIVGKAHHD